MSRAGDACPCERHAGLRSYSAFTWSGDNNYKMSIPNFRKGIINILVLAFTFFLNAATTSSPVVSYFHCVMAAYLKPWGDEASRETT